jgi:hypothetical protein
MGRGVGSLRKIIAMLVALQLLAAPAAGFAEGIGKDTATSERLSLSANHLDTKTPKQLAEKKANELNPSNYPLVQKGGHVGDLLDSYNRYQSIYYVDITTSQENAEDMQLSLNYLSEELYQKDKILIVEFFEEQAGSLSYIGGLEYDTSGHKDVSLDALLPKADFSSQPYIYMIVGVLPTSSAEYFSDYRMFKVVNPFYQTTTPGTPTAYNKYAVISNESVDGTGTQPTGTFNLKNSKYFMDKSLAPDSFKVDVKKPFDLAANKGKVVRKSRSITTTSFKLGDQKYFWVTNLERNTDYQINARLAYSGTKANVWVYNNELTDVDAQKLGHEFDSKIHPSVVSNFGIESDVNQDGKVNILCFDIQDGYTNSGGFVSGYFWAGDLYSGTGSNQSEIFYIDTYPTMDNGGKKDVSQAYSTLAHEFQHMVNFNRNVLIEGSDTEMDIWLDEALAMAAEQIYTGQGLYDRIYYYNQSSSIRNGHSLLYWDHYGDTLANYSLSYLFGQYLKLQTSLGNQVFRKILEAPNNNYLAVEKVAKDYINPNLTFGQLMTNFRIALLFKEATGIYGFKGDPIFDAVKTQIYTGNTASLRGGGAVVKAYNSEDGFKVPDQKGSNVTYTLLNVDREPGEADTIAPASPVVKVISDAETILSGTVEPNVTVYAKVGPNEIGRTISSSSGDFTLSITKQTAGTVIDVFAEDIAGNVSVATKITVTASAKKFGWVSENGNWYYYDLITGVMKTGWLNADGSWYFLDDSGVMKSGWLKTGGSWYFLTSSGAMKTGWLQTGGVWYYLSSGGAMKTGWLNSGGTWYFFNTSGAMKTGWLNSGGTWYYFHSTGAMQTGWQLIGGKWYHFTKSGAMEKGWKLIGTKWYYFYSDGSMAANTTIGGYKIGRDGAML